MKKLTQKLVLSVITMALVVVALGTSTFAWFTLTNKATISAFQAQVTAGEGIEITLGKTVTAGIDGTMGTADDVITYGVPTATTLWYTVLPESVIEDYIAFSYSQFRLDNVTSPDGENFYDEEGTLVETSNAAPFLEFKLYFRSSEAKTIVWNYASLGGTKETWTINVPSFKDSDNLTTRLLNSTKQVAAWTGARISVTGAVGSATYQAPVGISDGVYNSNAGVESFALTPTPTVTPTHYTVGSSAYGAGSYGLAAGKETTYGNGVDLPTIADTSLWTGSNQIVTLTGPTGAYYNGDVMVRIWIEGFDADTYDAIFDTELSVQIGFTVA